MCNLKSKGDLTLKLLNLDLFFKEYPIFVLRIYQIQNVISQLIFEILERFFLLSTSLKYFYQKRYKNLELKDVSKCDEKMKFVRPHEPQ